MNKYSYNFTEQAKNDVDNIADYLEHTLSSPQTAKNFLLTIKEKIEMLCIEPNISPRCQYTPYAQQGIRCALVKNYKLYYTVNKYARQLDFLFIKHCLQEEVVPS